MKNLLSLSLKLSKFTSFKQKGILMKTFVDSQFQVIYVYEFQQNQIFMKTFVESQFEVI